MDSIGVKMYVYNKIPEYCDMSAFALLPLCMPFTANRM